MSLDDALVTVLLVVAVVLIVLATGLTGVLFMRVLLAS